MLLPFLFLLLLLCYHFLVVFASDGQGQSRLLLPYLEVLLHHLIGGAKVDRSLGSERTEITDERAGLQVFKGVVASIHGFGHECS